MEPDQYEALKAEILEAFDVTEEETESLPWATAEVEAKAERQRYSDVVIPEVKEDVLRSLNDALEVQFPGSRLHFEFGETQSP